MMIKSPSPILPSRQGFSLIELLIGVSMAAIITAVCLGSYVTLQRGFVFTMTWSDLESSLCRARDSMSLDLRNATKIEIVPTAPIQTLKLTIPQAYKSGTTIAGTPNSIYIRGDSRVSSENSRAGDPAPDAVFVSVLSSTTGQLIYSGSIVVTYSGTASGRGQILQRMVVWTGTSAALSGTAVRDVANFSNGANITFQLSGTAGGISYSDIATTGTTRLSGTNTSLRMLLSGTTNDRRKPISSGTLQDTIYLRAFTLQ